MSITALAEECGVAEATISRFCRTHGFSGYNDFKLALAKASGAPAADDEVGIYGKVLPEDSITDMCKKLYATNVAAIGQTLAQIDEENVGRAVKYLSAAQRVYCFGQGGSLVIAGGMGAFHYSRTPVPVHRGLPHAGHGRGPLRRAGRDPLLLLLGQHPGHAGRAAAREERGAKIILITHFSNSPAAALSDVILLCGSNESPLQSGSIAAKIGQMFIIDYLFYAYCLKNPERCAKAREATAQATARKLL